MKWPCIAFLLILIAAPVAMAQIAIPGRVVDVIDGRTLVVDIPSGRVQVELQYIEVPEHGSGMSEMVKNHLSELAAGKPIDYIPRQIRSDRTVGEILARGVDLSKQMLRDGAAWLPPPVLTGQTQSAYEEYLAMESAARSEKRGVWAEPSLHPSWENKSLVSKAFKPRPSEAGQPAEQAAWSAPQKAKPAGRSNPRLGDVGALFNDFDPATGRGYLSTSLMGVDLPDEAKALGDKMAVDLSYYYKEEPDGSRKGSFVFTVVAVSPKERFAKDNELILSADGKDTPLGKPRRIVSVPGEACTETLYYSLTREQLQKLAFGTSPYLKVGPNDIIVLTGFQYFVNTMLQVAG